MTDHDESEETLAEGSLISHLLELRDRLISQFPIRVNRPQVETVSNS